MKHDHLIFPAIVQTHADLLEKYLNLPPFDIYIYYGEGQIFLTINQLLWNPIERVPDGIGLFYYYHCEVAQAFHNTLRNHI